METDVAVVVAVRCRLMEAAGGVGIGDSVV